MSPVELDGEVYPSVEHAYQSAKTMDTRLRKHIQNTPTPGAAKKAGRKLEIRKDWEEIKLSVMEDLVRQKFTNNSLLKQRLLDTGNEPLIEGNTWGDQFWGVSDGKGLNHLGFILMDIREELRNNENS